MELEQFRVPTFENYENLFAIKFANPSFAGHERPGANFRCQCTQAQPNNLPLALVLKLNDTFLCESETNQKEKFICQAVVDIVSLNCEAVPF